MVNLIKLNLDNNVVINNEIVNYKSPSKIYLPVFENVSLREKQYIYKNSRIGKYASPISGYVSSVKKISINNKLVNSIEIVNDYKENIKKKQEKFEANNYSDFLEFLSNNYLNNINKEFTGVNSIKNLIVSAIDEENAQNEFVRLAESYAEISETIDFLKNILNINHAHLAIKNTDYKSIKNVKSIIGTYLDIEINLVPNKYLIGNKHFLCDYLNIKEDETVVLSASDVYNVYLAKKGKDTSLKYISIYGDEIKSGIVVCSKLYCSVKEILDDLNINHEGDFDIYINGELGGWKVDNLDSIIVTEELNSVIINRHKDYIETLCINCGMCKKVCPFGINVKKNYFNNIKNNKCIGCGLCNYYCPAKILLKEKVFGDNYEK